MQDNGLPDPPGQCARRLAGFGIRPTAQRVRIAALLLAAPQHLSAEQILAALRASGARVSKATVYNTLNLFAGRGVIRQLTVDGARTWFRLECRAALPFPGHGHRGPDGRARPRGRIRAPARAAPRHRNGRHRPRDPGSKNLLKARRFLVQSGPRDFHAPGRRLSSVGRAHHS